MLLSASGLPLGQYEFAIILLLAGAGWIVLHLIQLYRKGAKSIDWAGMWGVGLIAATIFVPMVLGWLNGGFK